jgi:excisionase family DNA binding protein
MAEPDLMTAAQTAKKLGCSPRTVARMAEDGRITPAMKLPGETGAYLFDLAEVERVLGEIEASVSGGAGPEAVNQ